MMPEEVILGYLEEDGRSESDTDRILRVLTGRGVSGRPLERARRELAEIDARPEPSMTEVIQREARSSYGDYDRELGQGHLSNRYDMAEMKAKVEHQAQLGAVNQPQRKVEYPSFQTRQLPGVGQASAEQMPLFRTERVHETNYYRPHESQDAADWSPEVTELKGSDLRARYGDPKSVYINADGYIHDRGSFNTFGFHQDKGTGTTEIHREHARKLRSGSLGWDGPNDSERLQAFSKASFDDFSPDTRKHYGGGHETTWSTPDDEVMGRVVHHQGRWENSTYVDTAEISEPYKGRGFSREAMPRFWEQQGEGIVYAGSFTDDGERSFHAKGIPTEDDVEVFIQDYADEALQADHKFEYPDPKADDYVDYYSYVLANQDNATDYEEEALGALESEYSKAMGSMRAGRKPAPITTPGGTQLNLDQFAQAKGVKF